MTSARGLAPRLPLPWTRTLTACLPCRVADDEHGVDFHLLGALDLAVDLVGADVDFRADHVARSSFRIDRRVIHELRSSPMVRTRTCSGASQSGKLPA